MHRKLYFGIVTLGFAATVFPSLINTVLHENYFNKFIDYTKLKLALMFTICLLETNLAKRVWSIVIGWISILALVTGLLIKLMHWPFGLELITLGSVVFYSNIVYAAYVDKNKILLNYLLLAFILTRIVSLCAPYFPYFWWPEFVLSLAIIIFGIRFFYLDFQQGKRAVD